LEGVIHTPELAHGFFISIIFALFSAITPSLQRAYHFGLNLGFYAFIL
jgi:hypothetical protein